MDNIINYYYMTSTNTGQTGGGDAHTGFIIITILGAIVLISLVVIVFMMVRDIHPRPRYPRPRKHHRFKK